MRMFYQAGAVFGAIGVFVVPVLAMAHLIRVLSLHTFDVKAAAQSTGAVLTPLVPGVNVPLAQVRQKYDDIHAHDASIPFCAPLRF